MQVCSERFDDIAATVVCRQLGLPTPGRALGPGYFGSGTGRVWLTGVACSGDEDKLTDCPHNTWGVSVETCTHAKVRASWRRVDWCCWQSMAARNTCQPKVHCVAYRPHCTWLLTRFASRTIHGNRMWASHAAWQHASLHARARVAHAAVSGELMQRDCRHGVPA